MNQWLWGSPSFGQCFILFLRFWVYPWAIHESLPSDFSPALFVALFDRTTLRRALRHHGGSTGPRSTPL